MVIVITILGVVFGWFIMIIAYNALGFRTSVLKPNPRHLVAELIIAYLSGAPAVFGFENMHPFLSGFYTGLIMQLGCFLYRRHVAQKEAAQ